MDDVLVASITLEFQGAETII